jgi:L-cystine uptake protein TcyP (sodium:dicarboxylate symporter family)
MKKLKAVSFSVSPAFQKVFIVVSLGALVGQLGMVMYWIVEQLQYNNNLSSFYFTVGQMIVVPLVFLAIAYFIKPTKAPQITRIFEAALYMTLAVTFMAVVSLFANYLYTLWLRPEGDSFLQFIGYHMLTVGVTIILYVPLVLRLKR